MDLKKINAKTEFVYKNIGYGYISYERGNDFVCKKKGKLYTQTFERSGMEWNGNTWEFDGGLGLKTIVMLKSDLTPDQLKKLEN